MQAFLITFFIVFSALAATAQDSTRIKELERRVKTLETRVARSNQSSEAKKMSEIAHERDAKDMEKFSREDLARAEQMYQRANRNLADERSKDILDSVVALYPQFNRAGCAQLYRAQRDHGSEKERLLIDCINRFSDCFYMDGTQVGPLAMLYLAAHYQRTDREADARRLIKRLKKECRDAVGHDGKLLVDKLP